MPFENFMGGISYDATRKKYRGHLEIFFNPDTGCPKGSKKLSGT